jgi:phage-related protein
MAKGPGGFSVGRVSIQVVPDTSQFRQKLLKQLQKEIKGIKVEIPVDLDTKTAARRLRALDSLLKRIDGRNVNIGANVNSKGDLENISKGLSKLGKSASSAGDGFSHMSRMALIATAVILLLAPALALISTLIAGLPSLMFAFGFAALAVGLGLDGIKKAAEGFTPTIERLKKSLSKTFADQLTKPFIELNKIAPVLDSGLNKIAVSLSGIVKSLIQFITTGQGMAQLQYILDNTAQFFKDLTPAIENGFRAFMLLAAEASQEFVGLTATLRSFSSGFLDVVKRVTGDGTLGAALRGLNEVLRALLISFNKLFEAGLRAMAQLGGPMGRFINEFTNLVVVLMPILTKLSEIVFTVLGEAFRQLTPIIEELTPVLTKIGDLIQTILVAALKAVGPLLLRVAEILSQIFLRALEAISPFIEPFLKFITDLAILVGESLTQAFIILTPFLNQFFTFLQKILEAVTPLLPKLLELAQTVFQALLNALIELTPELSDLAVQVFPELVKIVTELVPILTKIIDFAVQVIPPLTDFAVLILDLVIPVMQSMYGIIMQVWPSIRQIIMGVLDFIQGHIDLVMGIITGDWERAHEGLIKILDGAWEVIKGAVKLALTSILDFFIGLPTRIVSSLAGLPHSMFQSGRAMMQGLIDGIVSMARSVVNSVLGVVDQARDLLPFSPAKTGPFSGTGYTTYSGRALMEDWAKGIQQGAPAAVSAVEEAMAATQNGLDINAAVTSEGFGDLQGQITSAMSGWEVVIDANGITKLVNKTNQRNSRR